MPLFIPGASPALQAYLSDLSARAEALGVQLRLEPTPTIDYNGSDIQVSGYFIARPEPVLAVAMGKDLDEWLQILIHEACHMEQWAENAECWVGNTMPDGREAVDWIDDWCSRTLELNETELADVIARAKGVELDCEHRAIAVIESRGLPIDVPVYAQRANAYVHFYDRVGQIRRWNAPGQAPYQRPEVWQHAPSILVSSAPPALVAALETSYPAP